MKRINSVLLALPIALSVVGSTLGISSPALAQRTSSDIWDLHNQLQAAVCQNNWDDALQVINPMLGLSNLSSQYRRDLIQFRQQVLGWRRRGTVFTDQPNCDRSASSALRRPSESQLSESRPEESRMGESRPSDSQAPNSRSQQSPADEVAARPYASRAAECEALTTIVNRADAEARSLFESEDFANLGALLQTLQRLANLSDQTRQSLQAMSLRDFQLRRYQQNFVSVYTQFGQATRGFVAAADANNQPDMETKHNQIQTVTEQETSLIDQVNRYCAQS